MSRNKMCHCTVQVGLGVKLCSNLGRDNGFMSEDFRGFPPSLQVSYSLGAESVVKVTITTKFNEIIVTQAVVLVD
jgi:hypothetical protein